MGPRQRAGKEKKKGGEKKKESQQKVGGFIRTRYEEAIRWYPRMKADLPAKHGIETIIMGKSTDNVETVVERSLFNNGRSPLDHSVTSTPSGSFATSRRAK